jgi:steroid 5-alpha reductase family enzyme
MDTLLASLFVLLIYMTSLFLIALFRKDNGTADIGYGIGFMVLTATILLEEYPFSFFQYIPALFTFIWGTRLALRIYRKNKGKPEDFRYRAWREAWGATFIPQSFLQIYMLQGIIIFLVALPVTASLLFPTLIPENNFLLLGVLLWMVGFFFESRADFELDTFIKNPENKGKIMTSGLWKYSRHPNYFGESLMWWSMALIAYSITGLAVVLISPLLITYLLLKVSGIPMLEKRWAGNPEWEAYKAKTSAFIPLPPR